MLASGVDAEAGREPVARAKALFGDDFVLLSPFGAEDATALARAFNAPGLYDDAHTPWKWLQQSARVRPAAHDLTRMLATLRAQSSP